ncbi:MAG TPA: hypothetical protein VIT02_04445 [Burkholderiaceae bacterium]
MSAHAPGPAQAYGFTLGRVDLLLDPADDAQYVADATVYPLLLAPPRVLGLIQVRGQPVPVLDADPQPQRLAQRPDRVQVLVVGGGFDAGALRVEHPPRAVELAPGDATQAPPHPECAFAGALRAPARDSDGRWWWRFDAPQLFRALAVD